MHSSKSAVLSAHSQSIYYELKVASSRKLVTGVKKTRTRMHGTPANLQNKKIQLEMHIIIQMQGVI